MGDQGGARVVRYDQLADAQRRIEILVQQMLVHRQGGRADVGADQRVGVGTGIDHHVEAELVRQLQAMGAFEEERIDIAMQQADQLLVAPAHAVAVQPDLSAEHMAYRGAAVGTTIGGVDQIGGTRSKIIRQSSSQLT